MNFSIKNSRIEFRGKVFDLRVDDIVYESGSEGVREVAEHNGGAVAVPVTAEGKIVFVKQFRYPLQDWLIELPAGKLNKGEDPAVCASRELTEETGYTAGKISRLGTICTTPGFCTEMLHIYLAEELRPGAHNREEGEHGMEMLELDRAEIEEMVRDGKIFDGKTLSGLYFFSLSGKNR